MSESDRAIEARVAEALGLSAIESVELDGGEVGHVHRLGLANGRTVAAKTSETPLEVEAVMLSVLGDHGLPVPEVYHRSDDLLVMEYVDGDDSLTPAAERDVARHLATLHAQIPQTLDQAGQTPDKAEQTSDKAEQTSNQAGRNYKSDRTGNAGDAFGFPRDTLTGPYRQPNPWAESWVEFYRDHRLRYFARKAREKDYLSEDLFDRLDALAGDLDALLPESPKPSLLHGDVWANNVVVADGEIQAFLDPACYVGHAEVELAYAEFSGFGDAFFDTYDDERGIDAGYFSGRRELYQLTPLLEHLLYFGEDHYTAKIADSLAALQY